jgi:hypothetical protein
MFGVLLAPLLPVDTDALRCSTWLKIEQLKAKLMPLED